MLVEMLINITDLLLRWKKTTAVGVICISIILVWYGTHVLFEPEAIRALPFSASNLKTYKEYAGQDWALYISAEIPEMDVKPYYDALSLSPRPKEAPIKTWLCDAPWWKANKDGGEVYEKEDGRVKTFAKYENGRVYVEVAED